MKNIFISIHEKILSGELTMREAAVKLYKAGWTYSISEKEAKKIIDFHINALRKAGLY